MNFAEISYLVPKSVSEIYSIQNKKEKHNGNKFCATL